MVMAATQFADVLIDVGHYDNEADAMLTREYRKPFVVPDKV